MNIKKLKDPVKFLAFSCPHCPIQDDEAVDWMCERIASWNPDLIVHLGDGHEADSASRWPTEYDWDLEHEFNSHNMLLGKVRKSAAEATKLVFLPGNHDDNLLSINRLHRKLRSLCDYRRHELELQYWDHRRFSYNNSRKDGIFRCGQVTFTHGFETSPAGIRKECISLGRYQGAFIHGHTNRPNIGSPQQIMWGQEPMPWWIANAGTLANLDMPYMKRRRKYLWGQGLVLGEIEPLRSLREEPRWWCRTEVFRLYNEWAANKAQLQSETH